MDFLKIRKKARERRDSREAPAPAASPTATATASPSPTATASRTASADATAAASEAPTATGPAAPAVRDLEELESALVARLGAPLPPDEGFTTWRPGASPPPRPEPPPPPPEPPEAPPGEFTLITHAAEEAGGPARQALEDAARPPLLRAPLDEFFYRPDEETPDLPELGAAAAPAPADDPDSAVREEYLTFLLGREEYAVAIERVREVVKAPPVTEVPRAPPHILGVVTVRGEVVAVLDPRRRLGLPGAAPAEGAGRIVIVDAGDGPCGLLVDAVASVVRLPAGAIEPCPQGIGGSRAELLAGIGRERDRLFTVLDLGALLRRAPAPAARRGEEEARRARP